jgi:hypothetical protein
MSKVLVVWFLMVTALTSIVLVDNVGAADSFHGIITSSATWTKANSPYSLDGPTAIEIGVTITVEPGVTVNLNGYYIKVNGTLIARGTDTEKIYFNNGEIRYTSVSNGWNEQTGSGSIFENTITDSLQTSVALKITKNTFNTLSAGGASIVTDNTIKSLNAEGTSTVTNNEVTETCTVGGSAKVKSNNIDARLIFRSGSNAEVSNNKISDGIHCDIRGGHVTIANNEIYNKNDYALILVTGAEADISNNKLVGDNKPAGIRIYGSFHSSITTSVTITQNQISQCTTGIAVSTCYAEITGNAIYNNDVGIHATAFSSFNLPPAGTNLMNIEENTIAENAVGIEYEASQGTITFSNNNIQDNSNYNFKLINVVTDVNVANNWWGTTDTEQISQKIYGFEYDFNLGKVNYNPILTSPVTETTPIPTATPTPTPATTATPPATATPTPTPYNEPMQIEQELIIGAAITLAVIGAGLGLLIYLTKKK